MNRADRRKADKEAGVSRKEYEAAKAINDEFRRAKELHQKGHLADAEASYKGLLKAVPGQPDVLFALGMLYRQLGDPAKGEQHFQLSLASNPEQPHVLKELGSMQYQSQKLTASEASFKEGARLSPADPLMWFNIGAAQLQMGKLDEAISNFEKSIELQGAYSMALYYIGRCHDARSDFATAEGFYRQALELNPDAYPPMVDLARTLGMTDRWEEALEAAESLNDVHSGVTEAMYILAWAQENSGAKDDAEETYRDILDVEPDHLQAKIGLANLTGEGMGQLPEGV